MKTIESKIQSQNRLIAEFMQIKEVESSYDSYGQQLPYWRTSYLGYKTGSYGVPNKSFDQFLQQAKFGTSWDWLMPVIKEINNLSKNANAYFISWTRCNGTIFDLKLTDVSLSLAHKYVLEFIEWYNNNKHASHNTKYTIEELTQGIIMATSGKN